MFPSLQTASELKSWVLCLHLAESFEVCPKVLYGHHCTWVLYLVLRLKWFPIFFYCGWICWDCTD